TATAHDHVNIFPTQADFEVPFAQLIDLLPAEGMLVVCADEVHAKQLAGTSGRPVIFYGLTSPDVTWSATDIHFGERTEFILTRDHQPVVSLTTSLLGRHNVENIVGVAALLLEKRLLSAEELARGIKSFLGVKRRMELLTQNTSVPVYEGFGSSYDKARAAIEAIRLHFPGRRLVVAFEPHTFSWRSRAMLPWYDDVFAGSDLVVVYEPASQGAATHDQVDQKEIVTRIRATGLTVHGVSTPHEMLEVLQQTLEPHDVVLILTSGGFDGLVDAIPALVEKTFAR
ncbi:hypothetical protein HY523_02265, partial [Candidatus Berkelbacteria bacterium]|nr:hypothetical protein [Candidatus Berkelbacteria bacterium]